MLLPATLRRATLGARAAVGVARRMHPGPRLQSTTTIKAAPPAGLRLDPTLEGIISRFAESTRAGSKAAEDKSKKLVDDFRNLQSVRVQNVLLVCSDYDSYTFEEDGLLTEMVGAGYGERNLTKPPTIERVNSTVKALQRFKEQKYDMVGPTSLELPDGCSRLCCAAVARRLVACLVGCRLCCASLLCLWSPRLPRLPPPPCTSPHLPRASSHATRILRHVRHTLPPLHHLLCASGHLAASHGRPQGFHLCYSQD